MGSVAQSLRKLFRGGSSSSGSEPGSARPARAQERPSRRSSGLGELTRALAGRESLCVLDVGPTSPDNIQHFTDLGYKVYSEDVLLASKDAQYLGSDADGKPVVDEKRFLSENLSYEPHSFDAVLCWDMADYMDESLVKPVVARMWSVLKPGGLVLAFFHTKDAGPDAPFFRYHISGKDNIELQLLSGGSNRNGSSERAPSWRLQRVFNNRHIENLFRDYANIKFFLARDNVREVLVTR
ncbi:MAG TPA: class I SAM-dependent methyltransferase [Terriglobales bacterium]|nr:class I SAM-dependent methyltransferase [Terriglobales bacterium]